MVVSTDVISLRRYSARLIWSRGGIIDPWGWLEISEGAARFRGTGVLVNSQWVVTAAHNWDAGAVTGMSFNLGGEVFAAESWVQHPAWDGSFSPAQGWDVGLIRLDRPVIGATPVALYSGSNELGVEVTFLGAGLAGSRETGLDFNALARLYAATNVIDRVIPTNNITGAGGLLAFDFDDGSAGRNTLETNGVYDANGNMILLPAEPFNPYGSGYGDVAYLTRISAVDDWIYSVIPEPGSMLLCCLGAGFVLLRRRRKRVICL